MGVEQVCLSIKRGDSWSRTMYFEDEDGARIDITGWTIFLTVKENADDPDTNAIISKTITTFSDPVNGEAEIELTPTDTAQEIESYLFDIQVKTAVGEIYTIVEGIITITKDVTIRTT